MATPLISDAELLALGLATTALTNIETSVRDIHRQAASDFIRGKLLPRISVAGGDTFTAGGDVKEAIAARAVFTLLGRRGYAPVVGSDKSINDRHDKMLQWLDDVWNYRTEVLGYPPDRGGPKVGGTGSSSWEDWRNGGNCNGC